MPLLKGEKRLISRLPKLGLVVDVGSCWGEYKREVLTHHPGAAVAEFDPASGTCAIGAEDGLALYHQFPYCPERNTLAPRYYASLTEIGFEVQKIVPIMRLDSLFTEQIDLLKIDAEGMTWDVLQGLGALRPAVVQFEWAYGEEEEGRSLQDFIDFFNSWGYEVKEIDWQYNWGNYVAAPLELMCTILR